MSCTMGGKPEMCCSLQAAPFIRSYEPLDEGSGQRVLLLQEASHLEEHGRVSLNRAIFMLAEQNTYNVKRAARCKETRGNMSRKQLFYSWYNEPGM